MLYESLNFSKVNASIENIWACPGLTHYFSYIKQRHIPRNASNKYFFDNKNILEVNLKNL